jgi:hypothetical protein
VLQDAAGERLGSERYRPDGRQTVGQAEGQLDSSEHDAGGLPCETTSRISNANPNVSEPAAAYCRNANTIPNIVDGDWKTFGQTLSTFREGVDVGRALMGLHPEYHEWVVIRKDRTQYMLGPQIPRIDLAAADGRDGDNTVIGFWID